MVKLQSGFRSGVWASHNQPFHASLLRGLEESQQPDADTTRMREAGVELVVAAGTDDTSPFAER